MHFRDNILTYTLIPLILLAGVSSYYRFMVLHDYLVTYEGTCDPYSDSCFVGCEDEECNNEYFYMVMERYAPDLTNLCGEDITECEAANICTSNETSCSVTYCDPSLDIDMCDNEEEQSVNFYESLEEQMIQDVDQELDASIGNL